MTDAGTGNRVGEEPVVLVAGADNRFSLGLTVMLRSALRNLDPLRQVHVFVLDGGLSVENRERCRSSLSAVRPDAEVTFLRPDMGRFSSFPIKQEVFSPAVYLRLLIPELIPAAYRRVLYLDSDILVQGDIGELWALPLGDEPIWAAIDEGLRGEPYIRETLNVSNAPRNAPYFNSGVMFIDIVNWRRLQISERAFSYLKEWGHLGLCHDQDALNAVSVGEWGILSPSWNFQVRGKDLLSTENIAERPPKIIHFLDVKPWYRNSHCAFEDAFNRELWSSGWYSTFEVVRRRFRHWRRSTKAKLMGRAA